jgi:acyl-coenzyme A thioesterase 13
VMGMTVYVMETEFFYPTINLNMDYFATAKEGDTVIVTAEVLRQGKTLIHMKASLTNDKGKLLAQGSSNLVASPIRIG